MQVRRGWRSAVLVAAGIAGVAVLVPLAGFLVSAWLLGWQLQTVLSGSMQPTYPVGSLLVVGQIDAAQVVDGMPIVFEDPGAPGRLVTHRVVGLEHEPLRFLTQGDANPVRDTAPVPARLVRGKVLWQIPNAGTAMEWLQWPRSFVLLVLIPGGLLVLSEWRSRRRPLPAEG